MSNESSESAWPSHCLSLGGSQSTLAFTSPTPVDPPPQPFEAPSPIVEISRLDAERGAVPAELRFNFGNMLTGIGSASAGGECREERGRSVAGAGVCAMLIRLLMNDIGVFGLRSLGKPG